MSKSAKSRNASPRKDNPPARRDSAQPRTESAIGKPVTGRRKSRGLASASAAMGEAAAEFAANTATDTAASQTSPPAKRGRAKPKSKKPSTREGKKGLVLYFEPDEVLAFRRLALDHNSDVQRMGRRALELLFAEYGRDFPSNPTEARS